MNSAAEHRLLVALCLAVVGLVAWNIERGRALSGMRSDLAELRGELDGALQQLQNSSALIQAQDRRIVAVEGQARRSWGGVRHSEAVALRRWISRIEGQAQDNAAKIDECYWSLKRLDRPPSVATPADSARSSRMSQDRNAIRLSGR